MQKESNNSNDNVSQDELDKLDEDLHSIDMLYRSRCVQPPQGVSNVVVREIDKDEEK